MTYTTLPRATVKQALEAMNEAVLALDSPYTSEAAEEKALRAAITALRAALAQQAEPWERRVALAEQLQMQQAEPVEPVAWSGYDLDGMVEAFSRVIEAHYQRANPFQNPVDMDAQMALRILRGFIPAMKAYTAQPQRKPLTSDKDRPDQGATYVEGYGYVDTRAVRAIERTHGIGGNDE